MKLFLCSLFFVFLSLFSIPTSSTDIQNQIVDIGSDGEPWLIADDSETEWTSNCNHYLYQQAIPQPGMHLFCFKSINSTMVNVSIIKDGSEEFVFTYHKDHGLAQEFFQFVSQVIGTTNNRPFTKWKAFDPEGQIIYSVDRMVYEEMAIVFTNGLWLWPGVREGFVQYSRGGLRMETLSLRPLVFKVHDLLTEKECDYIREVSLPHMEVSTTSKMDKDLEKPDSTWRTSTQYFLSSEGHSTISNIDRRVAALTHSHVNQQEFVQVLRYEQGQFYNQHTDYFDPRFYQKDPETLKNIKGGEKNRLATVLWYLSDVEEGGHTIFPHSFGLSPRNSADCEVEGALKVSPGRGEAVLFYNLLADGSLDPSSLHGACPVLRGTKWAANKWIWTEDAGYLV